MRIHAIPNRVLAFSLVGMVALSALLAGCATTDGEYESDLPWNTPQTWEGSPAIPGFDQR